MAAGLATPQAAEVRKLKYQMPRWRRMMTLLLRDTILIRMERMHSYPQAPGTIAGANQ